MKVSTATTIEAVRQAVRAARDRGRTIGLVPTMGALHAGHVSLVHAARADTDYVVASIFVNQTQFGPKEDFSRYPRPLDHDLEYCAREGVDLVFLPEAATIYPPGFRTYVEVHGLQDVLEGASRPGHFRGVATVVLKLLNIVQPDAAYFGQKDAQQARIIRQMVRDLDVPVKIRICPTVREPDGLALSSRNQYLDPEQRRHATVLSRALREAEQLVASGERRTAVVQRAVAARIEATPGAALDYAAVVSADSLEPLERIEGSVLVTLAVRFCATRLIDNVLIEVP
jgi:pantoate--beta-alanine ligase